MLISHADVLKYRTLSAYSHAAGVVVASIGCLVLVGWAFDIQALMSMLPGLVTMKANSALGFVLAGLSLWLLNDDQIQHRRLRVAQVCAGAVVLIGLLTLSQYLLGWELGIDQLLVREFVDEESKLAPGRMGPTTAFGFVLVGLSLLLMDVRGGHLWSQSFTLTAGLFGLLGLTGYVYSVEPFFRIAAYSQMALHTTIALILLCLGILFARPQRGLMATVTSEGMGGIVVRRLLPAAIVVPLFFGWLRLLGQQAGLYDTEFGVAAFALSNIAVFSLLVFWSAQLLHRTEVHRQQAEEKLNDSRKMLELVLDNVPQGVFWKDCNSVYLGCNRIVCQALGLESQDQLIGKSDYEFPSLTREQAESFIRIDRQVMETDTPLEPVIESLNRFDGTTILLETIKVPLHDAEGRVMGILGTWQDVTDRKRTVQALRDSEEQFRSAFDETNVAMVLTDINHRFLRVNTAFAQMFGYTRTELLSRSMPDITHPDDLRESYARREPLLAGESQFFEMEKRYLHKDGRVLWGLTNVSLVRGSNGQPLMYVGQVQDITERKRAEQAIASYIERLRILHQIDGALIAGEGMAAIAAAALPPLRELLGVARAIVNLFDLENGEVEWLAAAGRHRVHVGPGVRFSIKFMGDVEVLQRGERQLIDVHALPPSPEVDALLASGIHTYAVVPMIAGGELIGALSFGDVSEPLSAEQVSIAQEVATQFAIAFTQARLHEHVQRQAQELEVRVRERTRELEVTHVELQETNAELVKSAAELKAANTELDAFSYSVSHDLRAPLRAIDGFSRILLMEHATIMPDEVQEYLRDIRSSTQQMGHLVDDLLSFSQLSRQALKKQLVEPAVLVRQCLEELHRQQEGRQLEIRLGELLTCWADPKLLKQVWINLISNALKYTSKREVTVIEIGSRFGDGPREQTYFIKDNGVGFDMRYVHKLFGVFQRLHRAEDYEGTGVGLAIVQRVIHRHGGRVWAEAQPDNGATFYFTLAEAEVSQ